MNIMNKNEKERIKLDILNPFDHLIIIVQYKVFKFWSDLHVKPRIKFHNLN